MKIVFRVDAAQKIGTGHVMRCLALASECSARGAAVGFICNNTIGSFAEEIRLRGFEFHGITQHDPEKVLWQADAQESRAVLSKIGVVDWLIVDHYDLDDRWEKAVMDLVKNVFVIDDLANRPHDCQALLDQNLYDSMHSRYSSLLSPDCHQLLGPKYALLRDEFSAMTREKRNRDGKIRKLLVFFGGVDEENDTARSLKAIRQVDIPELTVDVVLGSMNPHRTEIESLVKEMTNVTLHVQVDNMSELMGKADLAIGAGGTTTWERCAMALPAMAWPIAENQIELLQAVSRTGAVYSPTIESIQSEDRLVGHITSLIENPELCAHMSRQAAALCDGEGSGRVANILMQPQLDRIRLAVVEDCDLVYSWRNHPLVRRSSQTTTPIAEAEHQSWFKDSVANDQRIMLIAEQQRVPVGVVRFDIDGSCAEVSVFLNPEKVGYGLGEPVLHAGEQWLRENNQAIKKLSARVIPDNHASKSLFRRSGYRQVFTVLEKSWADEQ